jgi:hypothetical protein
MDALCHLSTANATYPHFSPRLSTMESARRQNCKEARSRDVEQNAPRPPASLSRRQLPLRRSRHLQRRSQRPFPARTYALAYSKKNACSGIIAKSKRRAGWSGETPQEDAMFLGWYDPDRKKPARAKLADAIARYEEKFGRTPLFCLTSPQDAADLAEPSRKFPGEPPVSIQARGYIARWTFYIGEDAGETPASAEERAAA